MSDPQAAESDAEPIGDLGILFIHGVGEQRRGETLSAFGAPLFKWLERWFKGRRDGITVELRDSVLVAAPDDPHAPAHTWMHLLDRRDTTQERCLLAECCWAESFPVPNFRDVAHWAIKILPWTAATQLAIKWKSLLTRHAGRIWSYPYIFAEGLTYLGAFYLSALVQLLVVVLLILALIPIQALRDFILNLQLRIAAIAGDSYVLLENPIKANAIVGHVLRDIRWLANKGCTRIAVVAHSQGAAVAYQALQVAVTREPALKFVKLYFSVGSGLGKLHDIEGSQDGGRSRLWIGWVGLIAMIVGTILLPSFLARSFTDPTYYQTSNPFALLLLFLSFVAVTIVLAYFAERSSKSRKNLEPTGAESFSWFDRYASRDPVPTGPILADSYRLNSAPVYNRHSVWSDHTSYWYNDEEFVTAVARAVAPLIPVDLDPEDKDKRTLANATEHRRWRVRWLAFYRTVTVASGVFAVWVLNQLDVLGSFAASLTGAIHSSWPDLGGDQSTAPIWLIEGAGSPWTAALIVVGLHILWYLLVIGSAWRAWDGRETQRFFERKDIDLGGGHFVAVMVLAALPLVASLTLFWAGGPAPIVEAVSWLGDVPRVVWLAIVVSLMLTVVMTALAFSFSILFATGKREAWLENNWAKAIALCALLEFVTIVPGLLWLAIYHPKWFVPEPGTFTWKQQLVAAGVGIAGFVVVPALVGLLVAKFGPTGSRSRLVARLRESITPWLIENSWGTSWVTDPDTAHPPRVAAIVACAAGATAAATGFFIYRGWQDWTAVLLLVLAFFIALMMGFNAKGRAKEQLDPVATWLTQVSFWLAMASFYVPSIVREYWPE